MTSNAWKRTIAAYAAGIFVLTGLISIVALGGNAVSTKKSLYLAAPQVQVSK
jgi:hypothetical protein